VKQCYKIFEHNNRFGEGVEKCETNAVHQKVAMSIFTALCFCRDR